MATLLNDASHHLVSWTKTLDRHRVIHLPAVTFDAFNASAEVFVPRTTPEPSNRTPGSRASV